MNRTVTKAKNASLGERMRRTDRKKLIGGVIVVILLLGGGYLLLGKKSTKPQYTTSTAERGTLITDVTASGNVSSGNSVSVTTTASGVVSAVYVKNGDWVVQGQKIADITLDAASSQKQVAAYASYLSAQNSLNAAKSKMNSLQSGLFKANQAFVLDKGTANPDTLDPTYIEESADWHQAEDDYTNQQGVINQANASLSSAWLSYSQISGEVVAPTSGTVTSISVAPGGVIGSSSSSSQSSSSSTSTTTGSSAQTLATISLQNTQLQSTVNLSEIDITSIKPGQKVTLTLDAFPDKTFTGHVASIDTNGSVTSGVTTYPTTITFDDSPQNVYPNMGVNATIITNVKSDVILVPSTAVQTSNGQSTVRVLKNGTPSSVDVVTGSSNDTDTEIVSGINEGDTVITGTTTPATTTGQTTSPFSGLGGAGGRGFGGGGNATFRGGGGAGAGGR